MIKSWDIPQNSSRNGVQPLQDRSILYITDFVRLYSFVSGKHTLWDIFSTNRIEEQCQQQWALKLHGQQKSDDMSGSEGSGILTRYLPTETFRSLQGCSRRTRFLLGLNLQHLATSFDVKYAEHSNRENYWHTMLRLRSIRGLNWLLYMIGDIQN